MNLNTEGFGFRLSVCQRIRQWVSDYQDIRSVHASGEAAGSHLMSRDPDILHPDNRVP